ncbi:NAD(P)/FAD-dependent oxidoreductase [Ferruginibacter sp. HRS2-29]|uniref:FAD-dependent oxidoreductase n=1 Tax=Ferruginibacter sp. HRS2-29 TaxID=2487334 RepID=UPI0020CFE002|nr:NAD(P)/FAD-dependent oxidoreductase [Ferruginibacter sp. HRS2-29]MCP9753265.1 FAD-dependent monooxygenase [Ferruginibacter sp. HRS2-29]
MQKEVVIIGAGLVGSLLSIYLSKRGYKITIYERRADMRIEKVAAGRSINLALSDRGIKALEEVGIMDEIRKISIPMHGRQLHFADGSSAYQAYGKDGQYINAVSRGELNSLLMDLAEENDVKIFFNEKCEFIDWENNEAHFVNGLDEITSTVKADLIFGSDGAYAASRLTHQLQHDRFQYQQHFIDFGYKELTIPANENGSFSIEKNALHIWPRGNYMLIALPNMNGSFTCTLFFPFEGEPSFASLTTKEKINDFFENTFPDAKKLMPTLVDDFFNNPTSSLITVKCFPWIRNDQFALIGDAAHAIVPFFGQGMNCGFEDCSVLNELIDKHKEDWQKILNEYQELRKPDADAIADLALANFVEMRDKVGDATFLLQKKIEANFSSKYPDKWTPAYSLVTFSPQIRYSEALRKGNAQQQIMDKVMQTDNIAEKWNSTEVENLMLHLLKENSRV